MSVGFAQQPAYSPSALEGIVMDERDHDVAGIAVPRPEIRLVVRIGPGADKGLDVYALGVRNTVQRKLLRAGQRTVAARLPLGSASAVLGVPASALTARIVAIDELWESTFTQRFYARLAAAPDLTSVSAVLDAAVSERLAASAARSPHMRLVLAAAALLPHENLRTIAGELGVSERHLRRVFHETVGASPKAFAKLQRFGRVLGAARKQAQPNWAALAAAAGYYDQAHLIAEFRAISGATPRALLRELGASKTIG